MATIPRSALDYLTSQVNALSAEAQARVLNVLRAIEWTPENIAACRELVVRALDMVLPEYATLAARASADFYDASRMLSVGEAIGARAYSGYDPAATSGAIRAFVQKIVDGKPVETFDNLVLQRVDYELKRAAANSTVENGRRDPLRPRYARVPTGAETCDFCLMLASRGFVYNTSSTATMDHVHSGCDCRVVAGWPGDEVEGYDTQEIYDRWQASMDAKARERAERNGTTESEEYAKIMQGYGRAARNARKRGRSRA